MKIGTFNYAVGYHYLQTVCFKSTGVKQLKQHKRQKKKKKQQQQQKTNISNTPTQSLISFVYFISDILPYPNKMKNIASLLHDWAATG